MQRPERVPERIIQQVKVLHAMPVRTTKGDRLEFTLGGGAAPAADEAPGVDDAAGFETRIVSENITLVAKTTNQVTGDPMWNERLIVVKRNDTAVSILRELGATPEDAKAIAAALGGRGNRSACCRLLDAPCCGVIRRHVHAGFSLPEGDARRSSVGSRSGGASRGRCQFACVEGVASGLPPAARILAT